MAARMDLAEGSWSSSGLMDAAPLKAPASPLSNFLVNDSRLNFVGIGVVYHELVSSWVTLEGCSTSNPWVAPFLTWVSLILGTPPL